MKWAELKDKTVGIWGLGKEGKATEKALKLFVPSAQIVIFDDADLTPLNRCNVVITSPGVSLYKKEIEKARSKGIIFTSGTNLFLANKKATTKVIGVTGTKGKSTTSSIIYHLISQFNTKTVLGGNIGEPLLNLLTREADYVIAELSSYQCASLKYNCDIGVILNLYPEHLQWHQTHENYYQDKCRLAFLSHNTVANGANEELCRRLSGLASVRYFNISDGWHIQEGYFYNGSQKLMSVGALPLSGLHNDINACAALTVLDILNLTNPSERIYQGFQSVSPLPHRLQSIGIYQGLSFIDDSISTTPESTVEALKTFEHTPFITLIAGGFDRGQEYHTLMDYALKLKDKLFIIALPDTGKRIFELAQRFSLNCSYELNMQNAVRKAFQMTPRNGTVLLSPAAPSYNLYRNFEERGYDFMHWIQALSKS